MASQEEVDLPDDVWIEIFELLPPRQLAANVQKTCTRFYLLAIRSLLRSILWLTPAHIACELDYWRRYWGIDLLPKSLWIGPVLDARSRALNSTRLMTPSTHLYVVMTERVLRFRCLRTLTISHLPYSDVFYSVLEHLPDLRDLRLLYTEYIPLPTQTIQPAAIPAPMAPCPLPITHLRLQTVQIKNPPIPNPIRSHPLNLLTCSNLTHLAITWDASVGLAYQLYVHDPLGHNIANAALPLATRTHPRASRNLRVVEIYIPNLQYQFFEGLISLTSPPTNHPMRVKVHVVKSSLSKEEGMQLSTGLAERHLRPRFPATVRDAAAYGGVGGVWCYTGPVDVLDVFSPQKKKRYDGLGLHFADMTVVEDVDLATPLTHLRLRPPGEHVGFIVNRLVHLRKPLLLLHLEICIHILDKEIFYAVRELCPNLERLVVRYGKGTVDETFVIELGSSILPGLEHLHTLRILYDPASSRTVPKQPVFADIPRTLEAHRPESGPTSPPAARAKAYASSAALRAFARIANPTAGNTDDFLKGYLTAWRKCCPFLRRVQIGGVGGAWRKRWYTDGWHGVWVEDSDHECGVGADFEWDDGNESVDEVWVGFEPNS